MSTWHIKQGDRGVSLEAQLLLGSGTPQPLTGCTVRLLTRRRGSSTSAISAAATITNASEGRVRFDFGAGQTDTAGTFELEWEVTLAGGTQITFPNEGYDTLLITGQIA